MSGSASVICRQTDCPFSETGQCLEGSEPPSSCPHLQAGALAEADEQADADLREAGEDGLAEPLGDEATVLIPYGDDLSLHDCRRIMANRLTRLIVVAGESDSGKTTLVASLYNRFLQGPFAGYDFAGSETLPGWERRCHKSRTSSMRRRPDTDVTKGMSLLHLRLRKGDDESADMQEILFSDISGEEFEKIRHSEEAARQMHVVKRADWLLILIDGKKLIDVGLRQKAKAHAEFLLRRLLDTAMLDEHSQVHILFTKNDEIEASPNHAQATEFIAVIEASSRQTFSSRLGKLAFHRVAARSLHAVTQTAASPVDMLFAQWIGESLRFGPRSIRPSASRSVTTGREFDLFLERTVPEHVAEEIR